MSKFLTPPVWYDKNGNLNDMLTGSASSDGVAVGSNAGAIMGGVAVGYNANADQEGVAVGINASSGDGIAIGSNTKADMYGIAIGGNATGGGIAIGATATGNGIAIGGTAAANKVQLGSTNTTYDLTVGDGTGTLNIGSIAGTPNIRSIAFHKQRISNNSAIIGTPGVYLCCITTPGDNSQVISNIAICFINSLNQPASMLSSATDLCKYSTTNEFITPKNGSTMKYCFKIVSF